MSSAHPQPKVDRGPAHVSPSLSSVKMESGKELTYQLLIDRLLHSEEILPLSTGKFIGLEALPESCSRPWVLKKARSITLPPSTLWERSWVYLEVEAVSLKTPQLRTVSAWLSWDLDELPLTVRDRLLIS